MVKTYISAYSVSVPEGISFTEKLRIFENRARGGGDNPSLKNYVIFTYY
jgi:hypothetical protein